MDLSQLEPFEIKGEWWRSDGAALTEAFEASNHTKYRLDEGFALFQDKQERLKGQDHEHACHSTLTFSPETGLRLTLLGASSVVFGGEETFTLHGYTSSGRPCSVLDCFVPNFNASFPSGFTEVEILGNMLVHGIHLEALSDFRFDRATVTLSGLREFLSTPAHRADGKAMAGLGGNGPGEQVVQLDGAKLTLNVGWREKPGLHVQTRERFATAHFELEKADDFAGWQERWLHPLAKLVSFSTGVPAQIEELTALAPVAGNKEEEVTPTPHPTTTDVSFVHRQGRPSRERKHRRDRILITYAGEGSSFPSVIDQWWKIEDRLAGASDFLFGALTDSMTIEPRLVTLASVAEAYHRAFYEDTPLSSHVHQYAVDRMLGSVDDDAGVRKHYEQRLSYSNEYSQQERIVNVLKRAGTAVDPLASKPGRLARFIVNVRNYFVHLPSERPESIEARAIFRASRLLVIALEANLLLDLGIEKKEVNRRLSQKYGTDPLWSDLHRRGTSWPKTMAI